MTSYSDDLSVSNETEYIFKSRLRPSLEIRDIDSSSSKLCVFCAKFGFNPEASWEEEDEEDDPERLHSGTPSVSHRAYNPYDDVYPDFSDMERRAAEGCNFCAFLRNSLLSECRTKKGSHDHDKRSVRVIISADILEMDDDESTIAVYKRKGPHEIRVQVHSKESADAEKYDRMFAKRRECANSAEIYWILNYTIALQLSSGMHSNVGMYGSPRLLTESRANFDEEGPTQYKQS